jgi:hypothetical protein
MAECPGRLVEALPGALVCSLARDCAVLPWLLSHFATGGPRVLQRVRSTHLNSEAPGWPKHADADDVQEAILHAFEALAEDILDNQKSPAPTYVLELVTVAAKRLGDDPIAYLAVNRLDKQKTFKGL